MTTMKKILCMVLAFSLLLTFGCKKKPTEEIPDSSVEDRVPTEVPKEPAVQPPVEDEPGWEINTLPDLVPDTVNHILMDDIQSSREALFNSYREVGYFLEWQLGEDHRIMEVLPGDADGEYLVWGMRIKEPGVRVPFQIRVKVTPDGKDFSLLSKQELEVTEEWKAVQNYRWLVTSAGQGPDALLEALGFEAITVDNLSDLPYDEFEAAMLTIMTEELYADHWADAFRNQDGMLALADFDLAADLYLVEMVQPQEDGSYLSYEFSHDGFDTFSTFFVQVDLEEQPNGTFRVAAWDADNAALMEQAYTAMPID